MIKDDLSKRIVEQLAEYQALIEQKAKARNWDGALAEVTGAFSQLLGMDLKLAEAVDPAMTAPRIGSKAKLEIAAKLFTRKAELLEAAGRAAEAQAARARAEAFARLAG